MNPIASTVLIIYGISNSSVSTIKMDTLVACQEAKQKIEEQSKERYKAICTPFSIIPKEYK